MRFTRNGLATLLLVFTAACAEDVTRPTAQRTQVDNGARNPFPTYDDKLLEVTELEPSFAGIFRENGRVVILVTDIERADAAREALAAVFQFTGLETAAARSARYTFADLYRWKRIAKSRRVLGYRSIDVDESRNRITIGASNSDAVTRIQAAVTQAGVPSDALTVEVRPKPQLRVTLQDRVRNIPGGHLITFRRAGSSTTRGCTLGFNAQFVPPNGNSYIKVFATNSHCSTSIFSIDSTKFYQTSWDVTNDLIGQEAYETPAYNIGQIPDCNGNYRCKYTDILLAPYANTDHWLGYNISMPINRVKLPGVSGSLTISTSGGGLITLVHEVSYPMVGDTVDKIGKETGWTAGPVTGACVDFDVDEYFVEFLCQYKVAAGNNEGDSGSAVFYYTPTGNEGTFVGQYFAGESNDVFYFSSVNNIQAQLGGSLKMSVYDL